LPPETGELPRTNFAEPQGNLCVATNKGVKNVNVEKNASAGSIVTVEAPAQEETHLCYTSDSYQKILDYRVGEILLTTIIFGVIVLLRFHH
jgi:uncharacterized protein (DUF1330 family)